LTCHTSILQAGAAKVFISSRKAGACDKAVAALNALPNLAPGAKAISVPADSATVDGVKHLADQVRRHTDRVDILLANAGASWGAPFDSHPDSAIAKVLDLNVRAVFNTVREFAPLLQVGASAEDPSRVLVTASVAGLGVGTLGDNATFGYAASKAAAISLGRNLAIELGPRGITVNCLAPGFFPSKMASGLLELKGGADKIAQGNPMRRLGRPEDIAGAVVYLCSRAGAHVNGDTLVIDGGAMWARGELLLDGEKSKM
jgi:NAD(P)-dependent dehydrogenase (short-subunit alcohol dehydrogenase family)